MNKNVEAVKNEFNKDGQILESAFRFELIFKRHKKLIITLAVLIVACVAYFVGLNIYQDIKHKRAYEAYSSLLNLQNLDSENEDYQAQKAKLLSDMKAQNELLYDFYMYGVSSSIDELQQLVNSKNALISQLASYKVAQAKIDKFLIENNAFEIENLASLSSEKKAKLQEILSELDNVQNPQLAQWALLQEAAILLGIGEIEQAKQKASLVSANSDNLAIFANIIKAYK